MNPIDTSGNGNNPQPKPCDPDTVYFLRDVMPIFSSNCAMSGCHSSTNPQKGVNLSNYSSIISTGDVRPGNPGGSDVFEVITENDLDKRMPPPPASALSAADIATIQKWINQGAKNLSCGDCDTTTITFSGTIQPIIQANCLNCHNPNLQNGGLDLSTHGNVANAIQARNLLERINHISGFPPMPPSGTQLSACNLRKFDKWVDAGLPNN
jgi:hypothetical protein